MTFRQSVNIDARKRIILFFILFGLIFVRYCYFGFEYFYQLDDYIQYHNYTAFHIGIAEPISKYGLLSSRPLAGLFDLLVWSRFYESMLLAVAIISAMYAASGILLHKVFSKYFGTGLFFFVIYALLPTGFEGAYWVSASSRIIVGLFFAAISLLFFDKWCESGKKSSLVLFTVFQLVSFCFYEQVLVFSSAATFVIMLCNRKARGGRALWGFLMFANAAVYFLITKLAPAGVYSDRANFFLPWREAYFSSILLPLGAQLKEVFIDGTAGIFGKGMTRGFALLVREPNIVWCIAVILLCSGLFLIARDDRRKEFHFAAQLAAGAFLALAPISLFFIIDSPWFGLRNLLPSFCGFALIGGALLDLICCKLKRGALIEAVVISLAALLCSFISVSELYDYRQTTIADTAISKAAYEAIAGIVPDEEEQIWLLNVDASYVEDGNFYFHEHDYGVTGSDWALTGAIRAVGNDAFVKYLEPVSVHRALLVDGERAIENAIAFFLRDGVFIPVELVPQGSGAWGAETVSGERLGTLYYSGGAVSLTLN